MWHLVHTRYTACMEIPHPDGAVVHLSLFTHPHTGTAYRPETQTAIAISGLPRMLRLHSDFRKAHPFHETALQTQLNRVIRFQNSVCNFYVLTQTGKKFFFYLEIFDKRPYT